MAEESPPAPPGAAGPNDASAAAPPGTDPPSVATSSAPLSAASSAVPAADTLASMISAGTDPSAEALDEVSIEELLKQASFEDPSAVTGSGGPADAAADFKLPNFQQVIQDAQVSSIDLLRDVELSVKIELGRARMLVEDVLKLSEGSVVELDKLAGDPVDVFVNERLVARGEVLVLNDNFCVRVNEIVAGVKEEGL
jgi:flagellar motor switch protein FliN/FliY